MNPHCPRCNHPFEQPDTRFCQQCGLKVGAAPADPLVGMTLLGRYKVIRQLGEGSMGKVYLGEQRVGEDVRNVAIKVLASPRGNDDYIIARFRREASTLAALEHPNIIRLYDYGEENGRFVSVMEYISGGSLAARIAKARLDPATAENFGWQIARALDAAHRQGVVHRDLKPENVLLAPTTDGEPEVVKVVDFGIARRPQTSPAQRALTNVGAVLGTPAFMAPEQLRGETVDPRADVYSFALVVYQMLTARLPWNAYNVIEWTDAQLNQPPTPMRRQAGCEWLPARCDEAIAHALQKRPDDRTPSAIAFMQEFSGRDDAEAPIPAVRTPVAPAPEVDDAPLAPPMRRGSPWLAGFAVVAVASLAGGYGLVRWSLHGASHATTSPSPSVTAPRASDDVPTARMVPSSAPDGGVPRDARARVVRLLADGARQVQRRELDDAIASLQQVRALGAATPDEVEHLRDLVERLGASEVDKQSGRNCTEAGRTIRKLRSVDAGRRAMEAHARRCPGGGADAS